MLTQARHRSRFLSCLAVLLAAGLAWSPVPASGTSQRAGAPTDLSPPPTVGALLPLTGALSSFGAGMADAIQLLNEQVNASGGIRGTNLTIERADTQSTTTGARAGATDLIQSKGVQAIVGGAFSAETLAASEVTEPAGVVLMSPSSTSPVLTTSDSSDLLWRTTASDSLEGKAAAGFVYSNLSYRRVGVLAMNNAYGTGIASSFRENFTDLGGNVSVVILFSEFKTNYTTELTELFAANPEAVYLVTYPNDGTTIFHNWWSNHTGWPTHWILTDTMDDQPTMDSLRSTGVNTTGFIGLVRRRSPATTGMDAYERFRGAYAARFGSDPIRLAENAYDSAFVIALAIHASRSTDPALFKTAIRYVANPPGMTILPGQWAEAIAALDAGQDIDYWGAANRVDFDASGDTGTAYSVWSVNATGAIRTGAVLDEPLFWTPGAEGFLPARVTLESPAAGTFLAGHVMIAGTAFAGRGLVAVQLRVDAGPWQDANGTTNWTFDLDTTTLSDGTHRLAARSFDGNAYSSEQTVEVSVDNTPPSVTIDHPAAAGYVAASRFTAMWSATDALSGVETVEIRLDTQAAVVLPASATRRDFTNVSEGAHTLSIRAIDRLGNARNTSVAFTADGEGPEAAFETNGTLGEASWFTSDVRISLAFHDSGAGLGTTFIRVDENLWQTYTAPLLLTADGVYNVSFYAEDRVGNVGGLTTVRIPIDRTAPTLAIDPVPAILGQSHVTIGWSGSDAASGIERYEISVDGGAFESTGMGTNKALTLTDGNHTIRVRAMDGAGHSTVTSIETRIDTNVFSFTGPYAGAPTIGLPIGVAAIAIALVLLRRRKRLRGETPPPPEAGGPSTEPPSSTPGGIDADNGSRKD